jgi:hypothetical protein
VGSPTPGGPTPLACSDGVHAAASTGRRLTPAEYRNAISAVFDDKVAASAQYPATSGKSVTGFSTEPALSIVGAQDVENILLASEEVAQSVAGQVSALLPCAANAPTASCASSFISTYARRAYRHTPTADETNALMGLFNNAVAGGLTFGDAIAVMTDGMLQSPQFLYVLEDAAPAPRALTSEEIASRLSFLFWDSPPDDALLAKADADALNDTSSILAEAARLYASPKAAGAASRFVREWTGTKPLDPASKDNTLFPYLNADFATSFNGAFDRFSQDQMLSSTNTLSNMLTTSEGWIDQNMATFYGVPAPTGGQWAKTSLDPNRAGGLLTQPAMMAALAHPTTSSFIFRGKFVRERLLCQTLGAPPANAQAVFSTLTLPPDPTGKDQSAGILSQSFCAGCHTLLNPPGLAFETFDAMGQYRSSYSTGKPIDASGTMVQVGADTLTFTDAADLAKQLSARPEVQACFAQQVFRYSLSRMDDATDACAVQAVNDALTRSNGQISQALFAMTTTDAFRFKVDP